MRETEQPNLFEENIESIKFNETFKEPVFSKKPVKPEKYKHEDLFSGEEIEIGDYGKDSGAELGYKSKKKK